MCHEHDSMADPQNEKRWANEQECDIDGNTYVARSLRGRTAGMLGYGALGRETARLLKSHGMRIIAANTSGNASTQDGVGRLS
jgi:phosphoglycerate dehydrogenase-like enzyme